MKRKILVTGANGQLGSELKKLSKEVKHEFLFIDINELNLTDRIKVEDFFNNHKFDFVINCAAYTAVDRAETERDTAFAINVTAVDCIADASFKYGFKLVHISTDFVFNGKNNIPYMETDITAPVNYYGETKLQGENLILGKLENGLILRTSWLYSNYGNNFVKTMLKLSETRNKIDVVFDQIGTPTYAYDLAKLILIIIEQTPDLKGVFHYSNEGVSSWYDFAWQIFKIVNKRMKINPVSTESYPTPAKRPQYSVMNKSKIKSYEEICIPYWIDSLHVCLREKIK